jgi:hypothetical protein
MHFLNSTSNKSNLEIIISVNNELDVKLIKEDLFVKVKPGLSSYAKEPEKVKLVSYQKKMYIFVILILKQRLPIRLDLY